MNEGYSQAVTNLANKLESKKSSTIKSLVGFDGFIDEIVHVVKKRVDKDNYERELTLKDYGERIARTSGISSNVEIVTVSKKVGGNGPIMTNALNELGVNTSYIGALGYPEVNPIFRDLAARCEHVYTMCEPSMTDAVEFDDGKIIRTKLSAFDELSFDMIKERVGLSALAKLMDESTLISFVNWALPPYSSQIWEGVLKEVLPLQISNPLEKTLFFDIADPYSRPQEAVKDILGTIGQFSEYYNVVLGLNLSEAVQIANLFGGSFDFNAGQLHEVAGYVRKNVNVAILVIHNAKEVACDCDDGYYHWETAYCRKPKLTTGAGDNFNAGFSLGLALALEPEDALLMGMAVSGFYIRNARSANFEELIQFIKLWAKGELD
ncbi:MAG: hypothetical protein HN389_11560 [Clostridia bacterium]|jgi:hypothetical protein|nr:hypothetical protein [Clostridia bacterium]